MPQQQDKPWLWSLSFTERATGFLGIHKARLTKQVNFLGIMAAGEIRNSDLTQAKVSNFQPGAQAPRSRLLFSASPSHLGAERVYAFKYSY